MEVLKYLIFQTLFFIKLEPSLINVVLVVFFYTLVFFCFLFFIILWSLISERNQ